GRLATWFRSSTAGSLGQPLRHDLQGGAHNRGAVFKVDKSGTETVLYSFTSGADGGSPVAQGLVSDRSGNLYGVTAFGGDVTDQNPFGCGVVFKLSPHGRETVLHSFASGETDGCGPIAGLFRDTAGNLYGTTLQGGSATGCDGMGCGTVFRLEHPALE